MAGTQSERPDDEIERLREEADRRRRRVGMLEAILDTTAVVVRLTAA
jgi:hypothetical protein